MKSKFDIGSAFYKRNDLASDRVFEVISYEVHATDVIYKLKVYEVVLSNCEIVLKTTPFPSYYVGSYLERLEPIQIFDYKVL